MRREQYHETMEVDQLMHGPGCPWYDVRQVLPANVNWCEAERCSFIIEPLNTWSNLAYILFGLWILLRFSRTNPKIATYFGLSAVVIGFGSGVYHATAFFGTQVVDFFVMYLMTGLMMTLNFKRMKKIADHSLMVIYMLNLVIPTALTVVMYQIGFPFQAFFFVLLMGIVLMELKLKKLSSVPINYRFIKYAVFTGGLAVSCSAVDVSRMFCWPESLLFQGHAYWHVFSALAFFFVFLFYRQFEGREI